MGVINVPCVSQFVIIEEFDKDKDYSNYEPEKYHCVAIEDDFLDDWWDNLALIKTYLHRYSRPEFALARFGVTLIPPESLESLYDIVASDHRSKSAKELIDLMILIRQAISDNKYVIHYGV